jgi:transcriptional regulator with XRE-family HTH domain
MPGMVTSVGDLGQFLRARRDAADPAHLGIVSYGQRRVPGLRRDELAQLAGVSVAYYTRLEQGQSVNASASVIDAIATALRLNHAERTHLHALARPAPARRRRAARPERPSDGALQLLDAMPEVPALLLGRSTDILGWNRLGHQLSRAIWTRPRPAGPANGPTRSGCFSATRTPASCTADGMRRPPGPSHPCATSPATIPTTAPSPNSSAS